MIPVPGVYMIRNKESGRTYVGSSRNVAHRCRAHVQDLTAQRHSNIALQEDWVAYGSQAFLMALLEPLDSDGARLNEAELRWSQQVETAGYDLYCGQIVGRGDTRQITLLPGLRRWRLKAALSQRALATLAGVAASTIARVELGKETHPSTMGKLAEALKCRPIDLMEPESN